MFDRREMLVLLGAATALGGCGRKGAGGAVRIGVVAKSLGIGFFNAVHRGAEQAATELGKVQILFTGPPTPTAEGQIQVIESLVAQRVDAIAVSANDPDALVPSCKKALERGIKVVSYDSAVAPAGRIVNLGWSSNPLIGQACIDFTLEATGPMGGKFAILSATPTSTNQNSWIAEVKQRLPATPQLQLVTVVYGDDLADKSYRETIALMQQHPEVVAILAPTTVGMIAAAKAVQDAGKTGKVHVTGAALPSEVAGFVKSGVVRSFFMGNPVDLGYSTVQLAYNIVRGAKAGPGATVPIGRLGQVTFDADGMGPMAKPARFDASNIDQFAQVF